MRQAGAVQQEKNSDQIGLFGADETLAVPVVLPEITDWLPMDRLKEEFDAIGFYLSAHPLDAYSKGLERLRVTEFAKVALSGVSGPVKLAGVVISKTERTSQKGNKYAFVQLSDPSGVYEITVFSDQLSAHREILEAGRMLFIKAAAQFEGQTVRLTAQGIQFGYGHQCNEHRSQGVRGGRCSIGVVKGYSGPRRRRYRGGDGGVPYWPEHRCGRGHRGRDPPG